MQNFVKRKKIYKSIGKKFEIDQSALTIDPVKTFPKKVPVEKEIVP